MKRVGWEMQPLGWLLVIVIVIVAIACYMIVSWGRRVSPASEQES
jgi:hypothetical protein